MDPYFQDRHLVKIAEDINVSAKNLVKAVSDYKVENELTNSRVFVRHVQNIMSQGIKKIFSDAQKQ